MTKIVGAVCGSLLVFLLIQTAAHAIFDTHSEVVAYAIEVRRGRRRGGEPAGGGGRRRGAGRRRRRRRRARRSSRSAPPATSSTASNAVGPHLDGVVGRPVGSVEGFGYSDAMAGARRRLDAGRDSSHFLASPEEGRARHQDVLRRPAEARGPRQRDRLPRAARRLSRARGGRCSDFTDACGRSALPCRRTAVEWPQAILVTSRGQRPDARNEPRGPPRLPQPRPARGSGSRRPGGARRRARPRPRSAARRAAAPDAGRHRQPRHLGLRRPEVPGRLRALRLRQPRRAARAAP